MSAHPDSDHHTVGAATWQNHDNSPSQSVIIVHSNFVYVYLIPTFPPHCGDNVKVKTQHILSPSCSEAWVKQLLQMTGALFIAYDALRMNI